MPSRTRIVLAVGSLALGLMFVFPIWKITLDAPQYPEGLGMYIWINTITGEKQHDLQNINGLNHYIGMKRIEPDAIPELDVMPWFVGFLIAFGLVAAATGRTWMLWTWIGVFVVGALVGLVDFYLWEYDYGHNLDQETAIIKIPGMNYQPPLIGSKKLLNFTASSWPAIGGWTAFIVLAVVMIAAFRDRRDRSVSVASRTGRPKLAAPVMAGFLAVTAIGCTPAPQPLEYGSDQCKHCLMTISDERYGAELVTRTGKIYKFDSIECLANHVVADDETARRAHSLWVADFARPGHLVALQEAVILHSRNLHSPMGMNLASFGPQMSGEKAINAFGGETLEWKQVLRLVEKGKEILPASN